jgi:undecaprenyl-diphosphatase
MIEQLVQWDIAFFLSLNSWHSPFWDQVMWFISAKESWYPVYAVLLFLIFRKQKYYGFVTLVFIALLITLADQLSVHAFKEVFARLRPCHTPELQGLVHTVNDKCGGQYGFVSSHASNFFALATFLSFYFQRRYLSILFLVLAAIVGYSRIYLGVHFPLDVICGGLLGVVVGVLVNALYQYTLKRVKNKFDN